MAKNIQKTNAMRLLDAAQIEYETASYEYDESDLSGVHAAEELGAPPEIVFKTLVTRTPKNEYYVFVIPVAESLDLKKAAKAGQDVSWLPYVEKYLSERYWKGKENYQVQQEMYEEQTKLALEHGFTYEDIIYRNCMTWRSE